MSSRIIAAWITVLAVCGTSACFGQRVLGLVVQKNDKGIEEPLPGASVHWLGTTVGTSSHDNGVFLIDRVADHTTLVVSFVGYRSDTLLVTGQTNVKVIMIPQAVLKEVTVEGWVPSTHTDNRTGIAVQVMTEKELFKAACCNLSESFETNPSVDVAFTDAITGTRQIQMLGLSGPNTMISLENMPGVRGLASSQGIQFIPGTWINSIQVTKGVGSVINGYESIAGQINVELKKPQESDKLFVNGYVNQSARSEANVIYTDQVSKKWGTTFLVHGSVRPLEMDRNKDSFLDFPKGNQVNLINRWVYNSGTGWLGQFSLKYLTDEKLGGQTGYHPVEDKFTTNRYGFDIQTARYEATGKLGYQFPGKPYKSFGLQVNVADHRQDSYFGFNVYNAHERSGYANWIYQSILFSSFHKFKTGVSLLVDDYHELLYQQFAFTPVTYTGAFKRTEIVPGGFFEYSYDGQNGLSVIAGVRVDRHNLFGTFFTPRLHARYDLTETTTLHVSGGRGIRVANILAENSGFLASSRAFVLSGAQTDKAYGFKPDQAWNYGLNLSQDFTLDYRKGVVSVDYFYTWFQHQAVIDYDRNPQQINFYSLQGRSYSRSIQAQLDYPLIRHLDVRVAYRWQDVETDYREGRLRRPLVPKDRAFINLAYSTKSNWKFDYTLQRIGQQRLPNTASNPVGDQLRSSTPAYFIMNAQVTKDVGVRWSAYLGVENINDFRLRNPIIAANDPFGPYFDSSLAWGPVFGRMWYGGFRYRVK